MTNRNYVKVIYIHAIKERVGILILIRIVIYTLEVGSVNFLKSALFPS